MPEEITKQFIHGIGFAILWFTGMIIIPIIIMIIYGFFTHFRDDDNSKIVFSISFILYWIISAILLTLI